MIGLETGVIARLLLDHALPEDLDEIGLNRGNQQEWIAMWEEERRTQRGAFHIVGMSVLALHYATRKRWNWRKSISNDRFEIDLCTLSKFAEMIQVGEFDATTAIHESIRQDAGKRRIQKAQSNPPAPKYDWKAIDVQVEKWRAEGVSERDMASKVKQRFGVSASTYRDRRGKRKSQNKKTTAP